MNETFGEDNFIEILKTDIRLQDLQRKNADQTTQVGLWGGRFGAWGMKFWKKVENILEMHSF